jgi:hypothetical protein
VEAGLPRNWNGVYRQGYSELLGHIKAENVIMLRRGLNLPLATARIEERVFRKLK